MKALIIALALGALLSATANDVFAKEKFESVVSKEEERLLMQINRMMITLIRLQSLYNIIN